MKIEIGSKVYHANDGNGTVIKVNPKDKGFQALVKFGKCHMGWFPFKQLERPKAES